MFHFVIFEENEVSSRIEQKVKKKLVQGTI